MLTLEITIQNKLGLHTRASSKFIDTASRFPCEIMVYKDGVCANGKSIMDIITLGAGLGSQLSITADGPDEQAAIDAIKHLIDSRFGESQ